MPGNLWEWCNDFYIPQDPKFTQEAIEVKTFETAFDHPRIFNYRILMGGVQEYNDSNRMSLDVRWHTKEYSDDYTGFRLAMSIMAPGDGASK